MSKLQFPNTPLQQLKAEVAQALKDVQAFPVRNEIYEAIKYTLESTLEQIEEHEDADQRQAEQANNWSWRNGDDMGR